VTGFAKPADYICPGMNQNTRQKILWWLLILWFILHLLGIFYGIIKASEKKEKDLPAKKMERFA